MWLSVPLFLLIIVLVGVLHRHRQQTSEGYIVADRRMSSFPVGASLVATILGSSSTVGMAGLCYATGLVGSWWLIVGTGGLAALALFAPRIKRFPARTLPELIGHWYGMPVRRAASGLIAVAWLGIIGAQMSAAGGIITSIAGGRALLWSALAGTVFIGYTIVGGQYSVIRTDVVQLFLLAAGLAAALIVAVRKAGGWDGMRAALPPELFRFPVSRS